MVSRAIVTSARVMLAAAAWAAVGGMFSVLEAVEESVEAVVAMEPLWLSIVCEERCRLQAVVAH